MILPFSVYAFGFYDKLILFIYIIQPPDEDDSTPKLPSPPTEPPTSIDSPEEEFLEAQAGSPSEDEDAAEAEQERVKPSPAVSQEPVPVAQ